MKHKKFWFFIVIVLIVLAVLFVVKKHHASAPSSDQPQTSSMTSSPSSTSKSPTFDKTQYSLTDPASPWVIVNKQHPLNPKTYAPSDLTSVGNGQYMRAEAAKALTQLIAAAKTAGYTLTPASGYRSYSTQVSVYGSEVKAYGQKVADSESARPGYSEHQTGWAIDLGSGSCSIQDCFGDTPGGKWAIANAYKYGFILRYPSSKVVITGYRNESWHFRYIGIKLATEMHKENVQTLEEFFDVTGGTTYS